MILCISKKFGQRCNTRSRNRNPLIKSNNLAKTESLLIFVKEKLASRPMWPPLA